MHHSSNSRRQRTRAHYQHQQGFLLQKTFFCKMQCQRGYSAIRSSALSKTVQHCSQPSEIPPSHGKKVSEGTACVQSDRAWRNSSPSAEALHSKLRAVYTVVSIALPLLSAWHSAILVEDGERRPNPQEKVSSSRQQLSPCVPAELPLQSHGESGEQEDHDRLGKGESFLEAPVWLPYRLRHCWPSDEPEPPMVILY